MIIDLESDNEDDYKNMQSDLVRICLNLAFLPEQVGRAFQHNKNNLV